MIGEIAYPANGAIRIGPFGSALKKHEFSGSGIRVLGIEDVHPNRLDSTKRKFIPESKYRELAQYTVQAGDLLVTNMGTVGRTCVVPDGLERSIISSHLIKVSLDRDMAWPPYVSWALTCCSLVVAQIEASGHGAIMAGFNSSLLKELRIPLPPLAEQRRIADVLDRADALRAKRLAALAQLDALAKSIFLDMFGDPDKNPKRWPLCPVADYVVALQGGKSVDPESGVNPLARFRVLKISAVTGMRFLPGESKPVPASYEPPVSHFVRRGDLLFSRANTSDLVGAVAFVEDVPDNLLLPDKLWRFVWRQPPSVEPRFVWALFQTQAVREEISRRATGTSGSMKNISQEKVLAIETILPPLRLQREFVRRAGAVDHLRAVSAASLAELNALFASLQQRAFAGEL